MTVKHLKSTLSESLFTGCYDPSSVAVIMDFEALPLDSGHEQLSVQHLDSKIPIDPQLVTMSHPADNSTAFGAVEIDTETPSQPVILSDADRVGIKEGGLGEALKCLRRIVSQMKTSDISESESDLKDWVLLFGRSSTFLEL